MRRLSSILLLAASLAAIPACAAAQTAVIGAKAARAGGIATARLKPIRFTPARSGYGIVRSSAALLNRRAAIVEAAANARLAQQNRQRAALLHRAGGNVSVASLEQALAAQDIAAARLAALKARLTATYGTAMAQALIGPAAAALLSANTAVIQVSVAAPWLRSPPAQATARTQDNRTVALRLIGPAGHVAKGIIGQSLYYTGPALPAGMPVAVDLPTGASQSGYLVPRSALIYQAGHPAIFVETGPGRFAMTKIPQTDPVRAEGRLRGYFVPAAILPPGAPIAVQGAGLLLSIVARQAKG